MLSYIYGILIILFFMFVFSVIGKGFNILSGYGFNTVTTGFLLMSAVFYVTAFPFMMIHGKLIILTVFYAVEMCIMFAASLYMCYKNREHTQVLSLQKIKNNPTAVAAAAIGFFIILILTVLIHSDADDSLYLAQSSTILESGLINPYEQSSGIVTLPDQNLYAFVGYEVWTAVISFLFHINTAVLYHSLLPVMFITMHFLIMYDIGKMLFGSRASVFLILIMIFDLLGGYSVYSQGAFAMLRIWQGKSVLVNVIMPFLMLIFINILKQERNRTYDRIMLYAILLGGMFISVVGLYLVPLEYAMFFIIYFIYSLIYKKGIKEPLWLVVPVVCILPFVAIYLYNIAGDDTIQIAVSGAQSLSYAKTLRNINGKSIILPVFIICSVFFAFSRNRIEKYIFSIYPLAVICTIANPFLCTYVARYITGTSVYWRVFWLFQFNITICAAVIAGYNIVKKCKPAYFICAVLLIILCGKPVITSEFFGVADNFEKIDTITKNTADAILEREQGVKSLMMPEEYGYGIRQYTGRIIMIWFRYSRGFYQMEGSYDRIKEIYDSLYVMKQFDKNIYDGLCDFNTDYVLLYNDTVIDKGVENMLMNIGRYGNFILYRIS